MIITQLAGGLGNQLFQYAVGRSLALRNRDHLKLDTSQYTEHDLSRTYKLKHFNIQAQIATPEDIALVAPGHKLLRRVIRAFQYRILKIERISFQPWVLAQKGNVYLEGYWQSEKYFTEIAPTIREDLELRAPLGLEAGHIAETIKQSSRPVSLHVRRGDYVTNTGVNKTFGTCSPEYYKAATEIISKRWPEAQFFIFSDDIKWVQENLNLPSNSFFVSQPQIADYEEIHLMSRCRHHIIANSSFSWWGAWLNPRPDKVVIAPRVWFGGLKERVYQDIVPESWIKI